MENSSTKNNEVSISLAIPAYNRVSELKELLTSVLSGEVIPAEIIICEDNSPKRAEIRELVQSYIAKFMDQGCRINYIENSNNLGYDGNVRKLLREASQKWVMLIGNDDVVLRECFEVVSNYIQSNPKVNLISRSFIRFSENIDSPLGVSCIAKNDTVFIIGAYKPRMIFRSCGFVGGLIVNASWAKEFDTNKYDGSLFYQIYLAAQAFCEGGIGYISKPIVGGRTGNVPLFGTAQTEKSVHLPGSYTPKGRAKMWQSVLEICHDVGTSKGIDLVSDIKRELMVRQSFHVFEMMVGTEKTALNELRIELRKLKIYSHPVPVTLYWLVRILGRHARYCFDLIRKIMQ